MPGVLTGTIIGMAQALGETAPLLMIGMVAFMVDIWRYGDPATAFSQFISEPTVRKAFGAPSAAVIVFVDFL